MRHHPLGEAGRCSSWPHSWNACIPPGAHGFPACARKIVTAADQPMTEWRDWLPAVDLPRYFGDVHAILWPIRTGYPSSVPRPGGRVAHFRMALASAASRPASSAGVRTGVATAIVAARTSNLQTEYAHS